MRNAFIGILLISALFSNFVTAAPHPPHQTASCANEFWVRFTAFGMRLNGWLMESEDWLRAKLRTRRLARLQRRGLAGSAEARREFNNIIFYHETRVANEHYDRFVDRVSPALYNWHVRANGPRTLRYFDDRGRLVDLPPGKLWVVKGLTPVPGLEMLDEP